MEFLKDVFLFIKERKKWWLLPIIFFLVMVGFLIVFSNSTIAPFIYTLF